MSFGKQWRRLGGGLFEFQIARGCSPQQSFDRSSHKDIIPESTRSIAIFLVPNCGPISTGQRPGTLGFLLTAFPAANSWRHWIPGERRPSEDDAIDLLVRRCVAAFGPVGVDDIAKFGGQVPARIRPALMAGEC